MNLQDSGDASALLLNLDILHDYSAEWTWREEKKAKQDLANPVCKVYCVSL